MVILTSQLSLSWGEIMDTIMEKSYKHGNVLAVLLVAFTFTVASCSSTGMQRSEDLQSSLETVDNDIKLVVVQIDAIGASLDQLTRPGQSDVRSAFDVYSKNVSKIEDMEKGFLKHADKMISDGEKYFENWDKKGDRYDNPELQRSSDERRAELGQTYDKIGQNSEGVREAFKVYVSDVNEIEEYLANDLTTRGITSIESLANQTVRNGSQLNRELENLQSAIEAARTEMRQSGISSN